MLCSWQRGRRGSGEGNWPCYVFILCGCTNKQRPIKSTELKKNENPLRTTHTKTLNEKKKL